MSADALARRVVWFAGAFGLKRGAGPNAFLMGDALHTGWDNPRHRLDDLAAGLALAAPHLDGQA